MQFCTGRGVQITIADEVEVVNNLRILVGRVLYNMMVSYEVTIER